MSINIPTSSLPHDRCAVVAVRARITRPLRESTVPPAPGSPLLSPDLRSLHIISRRPRLTTFNILLQVLPVPVVFHSYHRVMGVSSCTTAGTPNIHRVGGCHDHCTHHRCWRRVQRSGTFMARREPEGDSDHHRGKDAWAAARAR